MIRQHGFSAVELLITLFIGTIFLLSGYQLFNYSFKSGNEAIQMSKASNVGYSLLRKYAQTVSPSCSPQTISSPDLSDINTAGLPNPSATITISCPYQGDASNANTSLVTSSVVYGPSGAPKEVDHAVYAN